MDDDRIRRIVEAALLASDGPLTVANLTRLFLPGELDGDSGSQQIRGALKILQEDARERGIELKQVASGYRYQVRQDLSEWVSRLWDEKPPRYTRALLETLALVAYKQPVTRGDIEQVRGVSVSQSIMRTLLERDWIRVVGQKEVPGRPALFGTTKAFLDYFNLRSLDELPPMAEIRALLEPELVAETSVDEQAGTREQSVGAPPTEDFSGDGVDEKTAGGITAHVELPEDIVENTSPSSAEVVQLHTGANQPKN